MISAFVLAVAASASAAGPTYLSCEVTQNGATERLSVTADEVAANVVTVDAKDGKTEKRPALFTPVTLKWVVRTPYSAVGYTLSRTDLSIVRKTVLASGITEATGVCKVQQAPERAF